MSPVTAWNNYAKDNKELLSEDWKGLFRKWLQTYPIEEIQKHPHELWDKEHKRMIKEQERFELIKIWTED